MNFTCRLIPFVLIVLVSLVSCSLIVSPLGSPFANHNQPSDYQGSLFARRAYPRVDNRNRYQDGIQVRPRNRCNKSIEIENGDRRFRERGSLVKFNCNNGYTLVGATIAVCLRDEWSEPIPYCVKAGCRRIVVPLHSFVRQSFGGGVIYFYCDDGFRLEGTDILICDGRDWNGTEPICQAIHPPTTTTAKSIDVTTENWEAWDDNIITPAPNSTTTVNINMTVAPTTNTGANEHRNNKQEESNASTEPSTERLIPVTAPESNNNSEISGNTTLTNSTVKATTENSVIPEVATVLPINALNNTSTQYSNSTENTTDPSHTSNFTSGESKITIVPTLLNISTSTSTTTKIITPTSTTTSKPVTTLTTTITTTSKPATTTFTTTTTTKPTATIPTPTTTTTTLKPTTTTTTSKPSTTTTTTTSKPATTITPKPTTTTTTSRPTTTTTTSRPTTTTTTSRSTTTTTTSRPTTTTTTSRPTTTTTTSRPTTTTKRPTTRVTQKLTTRTPWTTSKPTKTTTGRSTTSKPTTTTSTTTTPKKIVVPTTQNYWTYDYEDNNSLDNPAHLVPHRFPPIDTKGKKSPKDTASSTKASKLNSGHVTFGHVMYVIGMIVLALVSFSAVGVTALYCWRKNKGIARARSYDLDGRTLSAHDANEDFMWLENRDDI